MCVFAFVYGNVSLHAHVSFSVILTASRNENLHTRESEFTFGEIGIMISEQIERV